jgi:hypothetical protein
MHERQQKIAWMITAPLPSRKPVPNLRCLSTQTETGRRTALRDKKVLEDVVTSVEKRANNTEAIRPGKKEVQPAVVREFNVGGIPTSVRAGQNFWLLLSDKHLTKCQWHCLKIGMALSQKVPLELLLAPISMKTLLLPVRCRLEAWNTGTGNITFLIITFTSTNGSRSAAIRGNRRRISSD